MSRVEKIYPFIEAEKQRSSHTRHAQPVQRAQDGHHDSEDSQDGTDAQADEQTEGRGNVKRACELLKVSRAAYYAHTALHAAGGSTRARQDTVLTEKITQVHATSGGTYGAPRVHADLADQGLRHGRKRIDRLMRAAGIRGVTPKRWRTTTIPDPDAPGRTDLIGRAFTPDPTKIGTRWCGDITYIRTWEGWLHLATVIDLDSRRVVGWAADAHMRTDLIEQALRHAVARHRPKRGVIFHSDRGCQYTSAQFAAVATELGVRLAVGRKGECWDNAVAESFFKTIKTELTDHQAWPTRAACRTTIFTYIEGWYNTRRRHSTLGYLSPAQYENLHRHPGLVQQDQPATRVA